MYFSRFLFTALYYFKNDNEDLEFLENIKSISAQVPVLEGLLLRLHQKAEEEEAA